MRYTKSHDNILRIQCIKGFRDSHLKKIKINKGTYLLSIHWVWHPWHKFSHYQTVFFSSPSGTHIISRAARPSGGFKPFYMSLAKCCTLPTLIMMSFIGGCKKWSRRTSETGETNEVVKLQWTLVINDSKQRKWGDRAIACILIRLKLITPLKLHTYRYRRRSSTQTTIFIWISGLDSDQK